MNNPENNKIYPDKWLGVFCGAYMGTDKTVHELVEDLGEALACLLYTSPSPRDRG